MEVKMKKNKIGDVIIVKVSIAAIDENGDYICTHVGLENYYKTNDTDSMIFDESDIVER